MYVSLMGGKREFAREVEKLRKSLEGYLRVRERQLEGTRT